MEKKDIHIHSHGHDHGHIHTHHGDVKNIKIAFFLNLGFSIVEIIGGFLTNSVAILSDAVHDLGDSFSLGLAWYFQKFSRKQRDKNFTYGYKRFSLVGALINSIVLIAGSVLILSEAIPRIFNPQQADAGGMFLLAILGIIVNGIAVVRLRKGSSLNEKVVSLHMLEDVLGWSAVLIGAIIMKFTNLYIIDPILSVLISFFILFNVFKKHFTVTFFHSSHVLNISFFLRFIHLFHNKYYKLHFNNAHAQSKNIFYRQILCFLYLCRRFMVFLG